MYKIVLVFTVTPWEESSTVIIQDFPECVQTLCGFLFTAFPIHTYLLRFSGCTRFSKDFGSAPTSLNTNVGSKNFGSSVSGAR